MGIKVEKGTGNSSSKYKEGIAWNKKITKSGSKAYQNNEGLLVAIMVDKKTGKITPSGGGRIEANNFMTGLSLKEAKSMTVPQLNKIKNKATRDASRIAKIELALREKDKKSKKSRAKKSTT